MRRTNSFLAPAKPKLFLPCLERTEGGGRAAGGLCSTPPKGPGVNTLTRRRVNKMLFAFISQEDSSPGRFSGCAGFRS